MNESLDEKAKGNFASWLSFTRKLSPFHSCNCRLETWVLSLYGRPASNNFSSLTERTNGKQVFQGVKRVSLGMRVFRSNVQAGIRPSAWILPDLRLQHLKNAASGMLLRERWPPACVLGSKRDPVYGSWKLSLLLPLSKATLYESYKTKLLPCLLFARSIKQRRWLIQENTIVVDKGRQRGPHQRG